MKKRGIKGPVVARKMDVSRQTINQIDTRKFDIAFLKSLKEASGMDFTHYAYEDIMDNMPEESRSKYLESSPRITINISIATKKRKPQQFTRISYTDRRIKQETGV